MLNIVICGTPGTGKSTLIEYVKLELSNKNFDFINLSRFAIDNQCTSDYDDRLETHTLDEEKLLRLVERKLYEGSQQYVIECIHGDLLPRRLIDMVFVCRTDTTRLYDRLRARNYNQEKISNNMEAEIFQTILDEVRGCYPAESVFELINNEPADLDSNARVIIERVHARMGMMMAQQYQQHQQHQHYQLH